MGGQFNRPYINGYCTTYLVFEIVMLSASGVCVEVAYKLINLLSSLLYGLARQYWWDNGYDCELAVGGYLTCLHL